MSWFILHNPLSNSTKSNIRHTVGVEVGVGSSVLDFSGELSDMELTDETDSMDLFPKLETFPDSSCSSGSLSESCVVSTCEMDVSFPSLSSTSSTPPLLTQSKVCDLAVWSVLLDFSEEAVLALLWCLSFLGRQGETGAGETRHFTGDTESVRSMTVFSTEATGRLRLRKPSRGPRPLTKGGPLCTGSVADSFSLSLSEGSGQACGRARLGGWFSLGSGLRRLNGRRAAGRNKKDWSN